MSQLQVNRINDASGGVLSPISSVMRNRIINGAMVIDQRNAGASVTQTNAILYTLDRWRTFGSVTSKFSVQQNAGSVTPPAGFTNYLGVTSLAATTLSAGDGYRLEQAIEGYNIGDLGFGTANAKTITVSFWVRSSLTGTFGGALWNTTASAVYLFSYTISAANTWEYKTITVTGETSQSLNTTNGQGLVLQFSLGAGTDSLGTAGSWGSTFKTGVTGQQQIVGTNGATFYITGVQLEVGTQATSFEYRQYGTELALCQRYFQSWLKGTGTGTLPYWGTSGGGTTGIEGGFVLLQQMRATPTYTINALELYDGGASTYAVTSITNFGSSNQCPRLGFGVASGLTSNRLYYVLPINSNAYFFASAEL
jgi:hypothetical protein